MGTNWILPGGRQIAVVLGWGSSLLVVVVMQYIPVVVGPVDVTWSISVSARICSHPTIYDLRDAMDDVREPCDDAVLTVSLLQCATQEFRR